MLGIIHRTTLGKGPPQFREFFKPAPPLTHQRLTRARAARHSKCFDDPYRNNQHTETLLRSACGLVGVYNLLPAPLVQLTNVKDFQRELQGLVKARAAANCSDWADTLTPRTRLFDHPLTRHH